RWLASFSASMTTPSNRNPEAPVYRRGGKGKLPPSLRISRDGERLAGLEEGLEAGQDLGPAFLHGLEGRAAPGELVRRGGELAHQSHGFDLVGHARRLVLDELRLDAVHLLLSRILLDQHFLNPDVGSSGVCVLWPVI